jgi:putative transposase
VSRVAVRGIMCRFGLHGLPVLKPKPQRPDSEGAAADDLVLRLFQARRARPALTHRHHQHPTREGKLYCCVVLDAYSRRVVGWSIDSRQAASLVMSVLGMAISSR